MPKSFHPDLLVGFDTSDDAGIFRISEDLALVQTLDFFTPIVDEPYAYGAIAAANALSDVYAMGGKPITAMNIACFDPKQAPADVWASIFQGMADKVHEAGAVLVGGHTVEDHQPKFGLSVTGTVNPQRMFQVGGAQPGDFIYLTKPLGTGIITTAAKADACSGEALGSAIESMCALNAEASERALAVGAECVTDITGFGLCGHLYNVARASRVTLEIEAEALPLLPDLERLVEAGHLPGGARRNREYLGDALEFGESVPEWMKHVVVDPQTSGGLAIFTLRNLREYPRIGKVVEGPPKIRVV